MQSIFWHDYETFGVNPQKDNPCQFAGIRTDLDLNIIEEPITIYCKPSEDNLPSPDACIVTGITPQIAMNEGISEADFAKQIHKKFSVPGTCVAGYNSIRFDDEVSRNLFYRNFYDPYEREWKNGNSRWDIIDVVRLAYALRPEGINWPVDDNKQVSFRLERLTEANGIEHASAHDAMSDVYATIAMAKLIKDKQPKLYQYIFDLRNKQAVSNVFEIEQHKPVLHVSSKYPVVLGCSALVAPLFKHPSNNNGIVVFDLRQNPETLFPLSVEEIRARLYTATKDLVEGIQRPALKTIHINKCPMVVPASMANTIDPERLGAWGIDLVQTKIHLDLLRTHPEFIEKLKLVFDDPYEVALTSDPDLMIYSGGFFSSNDKTEMARVRAVNEVELAESDFDFKDKRLDEMLFRYKARNYPATLNEDEQARWSVHCSQKLLAPDSVYITFTQFFDRLNQLAQDDNRSSMDLSILEDLKYYAESIIPYS